MLRQLSVPREGSINHNPRHRRLPLLYMYMLYWAGGNIDRTERDNWPGDRSALVCVIGQISSGVFGGKSRGVVGKVGRGWGGGTLRCFWHHPILGDTVYPTWENSLSINGGYVNLRNHPHGYF